MKRLLLTCFVMCALFPSMLRAQGKDAEKQKFGLTFPNIGVIWHITDNVAFLPGFSFNHSWSSSDDFYKDSTNLLNVDASLRFYVQEWKGVRFYLAPKYSFGWVDTESDIGYETSPSTRAVTTYSHAVSGAWGLQYAISNRISIWGDIGVRYSHGTGSTSPSTILGLDTHTNSISTVGTWGLILYLK
jgi:hypothetical protein